MEAKQKEIELNISFILNEMTKLRMKYFNEKDILPIKVQADLNRYSESLLFLSQSHKLIGAGDCGKEK